MTVDEIMELAVAFANAVHQSGMFGSNDNLEREEQAETKLKAAIELLAKDAKRLEWLSRQTTSYGFEDEHHGNEWRVTGPFATLRTAIDAGMKDAS